MIPLEHYLFIGAALFCIGLVVVITKRNAIVVLMGVELMLNAANINLIAFSRFDPQRLQGQVFSLFVMVVAAAEAAVALALVLKVYHFFGTTHLDEVKELKG
jgi:NADH-quinone oxidoreductase subunit K